MKMKSKTGQELLFIKFGEIKETYNEFYTNMMKHGSFPLRKTEFGYWGYSALKDVFVIFKKIKLENYKNFIDLGSGDGKVVLLAGLFTNAIGFELDKNLYGQSINFRNNLEINNVKFYNKNYLNEDLSKYDVIYHYPDQPIYKIENKLLKEMNKKAIFIHYGNHFLPLQLKKQKEFDFSGMKAGVYKI